MKTRNGFVSNSSTSSFVILTTEKNHQNILKTFTVEEQSLLNEMMLSIKLGNIDLRILQSVTDQGGNSIPETIDDDLLYSYEDKLKNSKIVYSESIGG